MTDPKCAECDQTMERGYMVDHGYGQVLPAAWVAGVAEFSTWWGLKLRNRRKFPVLTYRCPSCGLLRSYAVDAPWPA